MKTKTITVEIVDVSQMSELEKKGYLFELTGKIANGFEKSRDAAKTFLELSELAEEKD